MYQNNTPGKNNLSINTPSTNSYQPGNYSNQGSYSSNPQQINLNVPSYQSNRPTHASMIIPQQSSNSESKPFGGLGKL